MKRIVALFLLLLLLTGCARQQPPSTAPTVPEDEYLSVHFIDVGHADCALLVCGDSAMLIDGGNRDDGGRVVGYLQNMGIDKLDLVVGTHAHEDHIGGLASVLRYFDAENVWISEFTYSNYVVTDFLNAAAAQETPVTNAKPGDTFLLGAAKITVMGPVRYDYEDINDLSLVLMVEYGEVRFLFTGDMEQLAEGHMLDYWGESYDWHADVLKVGHHGSYSSTGYRLLRAVMPTWGIIPCELNNEYGHPHSGPLSRLRDAGVLIFRMDHSGTVIASTNGQSLAWAWGSSDYAPYIPQ